MSFARGQSFKYFRFAFPCEDFEMKQMDFQSPLREIEIFKTRKDLFKLSKLEFLGALELFENT